MAQTKPVDNLNEVQLMKTAIAAAYEAGKAIMEVYERGDFDSVLKSDLSPLTRADRVSHDIISTMLALTRIPMLSEEDSEMDYHKRKEWNRFWLVDPLDGTKEFLNRNGEFTVNIALIEENRPVMGVILVPGTNTLHCYCRSEPFTSEYRHLVILGFPQGNAWGDRCHFQGQLIEIMLGGRRRG